MVHRQLTASPSNVRRQGPLAALLGVLAAAILAAALAPAAAHGANTRVSITDFAWSEEPTINLGESVTWDWLGPDLQHSVTGQPPNASQWDSDPGNPSPRHNLGHSYTVTFDQPGKYLFICKLHPQSVRGVVTVTNQPGDPSSDPGPQPPLNFDLEPPFVEDVQLGRTVMGWHAKGTTLDFANSERGTASIDYYRIIRRRHGRKVRHVRRFAGYHEAEAHIGLNTIRVAHRSRTFRARPGRYVAVFRVDDATRNSSPNFLLRFEIKAKPRKKRPIRRGRR